MNNKYNRRIFNVEGVRESIMVDVYSVLKAFAVTCPARQHAIKKILCAGERGKGSKRQDLRDAIDSLERALQLDDDESEGTGGTLPPSQEPGTARTER